MIRQTLAALLISAIVQSSATNVRRDWERVKPEDVSYSLKRLNALRLYLSNMDTTAMMVVRNGNVIFEYGDVTSQTS
jgi:hypothetical protein